MKETKKYYNFFEMHFNTEVAFLTRKAIDKEELRWEISFQIGGTIVENLYSALDGVKRI
jgi:hypothetical protein